MAMMRKMALMKAMSEEDRPQEAFETSEKKETYSAPSADPGDAFRNFRKKQQFKKQMLKQGKGKYAAPVRYKIRQGLGKMKDKVEDVTKKIKEGFQRNQAEINASGKTRANSSVDLCKPGDGKCQQ